MRARGVLGSGAGCPALRMGTCTPGEAHMPIGGAGATALAHLIAATLEER